MPERRFFMPPEWALHASTWVSWPHNRSTWPEGLEAAEAALAEAVAALAEGEPVHINVRDDEHAARVAGLLGKFISSGKVVLEAIATNDAWCRDHGAIVVYERADQRVALDFGFNAWGGKYRPFDLDDAVARRMAAALGLECLSIDMVLEGGAVEVNGAGALITTEQCLLNPNRNPGLGRPEIEAALGRYLGARRVIWLGEGIAGDDTDGHVDDITRFVAEDAVVTAVEDDPGEANHAPLAENLRRLRQLRLRVVELPMPRPLYRGTERLPASYANFYIGNRVVVLPVFECPQDRTAVEVLASCFPERQVVPIDSRALVIGRGAFHCLTQQVPS